MEEKERILQNALLTVENQSNLRQQAMELHKRKVSETDLTDALTDATDALTDATDALTD